MERSLEDARKVLQSQPFSRLLQAEVSRYEVDGVELRLPVSEELKQQHGFVHGGVLSYLADNALTYAGGMVLGPMVVTSEYKINYVRPALGQWLLARASVAHAGRKQAVCRCDVFVVADGVEKLCAVAQGTIARMGAAPQAA